MCGIQAPSDIMDEAKLIPDRDVAADNVKEFITIIRERLRAQQHLAKQIAMLGRTIHTCTCTYYSTDMYKPS